MRWIVETFRFLWNGIRNSWRFAYGCYCLFRLKKPVVTIFGGGGMKKDTPPAQVVYDFAKLCAQNGFSVLTGGGPGVMEAANCGARDGHATGESTESYTLGISVQGLDAGFDNPCATVARVNDFFTRKWLLILYSHAFVVFPGGIGTMDEIFDVLNLAKHHKIGRIPVILVDTSYWKPICDWYQDAAKRGLIKSSDKDLLLCVGTAQEAFELIQRSR